MKSRFALMSYFALIIICALGLLIFTIVPSIFNNLSYDDKLFPIILIPSIVIFSFIYLFIGELRTKIIIVEIDKDEIIVKRFFGLKIEIFNFSELDGWKYSHLSSRSGTHEYLYLMKDNKKVIKISEFYHRNYFTLKNEIQNNFKDLGYEKFSYIDEIKEIFK